LWLGRSSAQDAYTRVWGKSQDAYKLTVWTLPQPSLTFRPSSKTLQRRFEKEQISRFVIEVDPVEVPSIPAYARTSPFNTSCQPASRAIVPLTHRHHHCSLGYKVSSFSPCQPSASHPQRFQELALAFIAPGMKASTSISNMLRSPRTHIAAFLVALGLLALCYNILATFPSLASNLRATLQNALPKENYCTKDIGEGVCCDLFMAAEPCVEACREELVDRETFALTQEFEVCQEQCLVSYTGQCDDGSQEGAAGGHTKP
jgi:hypothetical protein